MKQMFYLLIIGLFSPVILLAQIDTSLAWERYFGGTGIDNSHTGTARPTKDGGYIIAGSTTANNGFASGNHGGSDAWIIKLNASGNIDWQKCYGGSGDDAARDIQQTPDGGYIIAAATNSTDGDVTTGSYGGMDIWIIKINSTGTIEWQKGFGGSGTDLPNSLQIAGDKGYVFTASTNSPDGNVGPDHPDTCYWCVKIDSSGIIQWKKCFNGAAFSTCPYSYTSEDEGMLSYSGNHLNGSCIQNTADGGFIIAAQSDSTTPGNHGGLDYLVLKLDSSGNTQWEKSYGDSADNIASCIKPVGTYNGFIIAGSTNVPPENAGITPGNPQLPLIIKLDNAGNIQWQKIDSPGVPQMPETLVAGIANAITITGNGDYVLGGYVKVSYGLGEMPNYGWLTRLDSLGNVKGVKFSQQNTLLYSLDTDSDGNFIAAGDAYNLRSVNEPESTYVADVYILKFKASLLPVRLINFTANKNNDGVLLQWQTVNEQNTGYFNVQRSSDAIKFNTIGAVTAAGNSASIRNYAYTDFVEKTGWGFSSAIFYRLQEVDKDGKRTLSRIVKIAPETRTVQLMVMPNPVHNQLTLRVTNYTGRAAISIFDMAGRRLQQTLAYVDGAGSTTINIPGLAAGRYIISAVVNGKIVNEKFVKE